VDCRNLPVPHLLIDSSGNTQPRRVKKAIDKPSPPDGTPGGLASVYNDVPFEKMPPAIPRMSLAQHSCCAGPWVAQFHRGANN